jgi:hypothetical protein
VTAVRRWGAVAAGRIAGRFELARAAEAHDRLASRGVLGKLLRA